IIAEIREALRALVYISVGWSGPERLARRIFHEAASRLEESFPELNIHLFHLNVENDRASQEWLFSIRLAEFAIYGSGSLIWLESGTVMASEVTANIGVGRVCDRSTSLWSGRIH